MAKGRTTLLQKGNSKGDVANNNRPIISLPLMWKLLTGVIAAHIYWYLDQQKLFRDQQKGCWKKSR